MNIRLIICAVLMTVLTSCQKSFIVKIEDGSPPRFSFYEDNIAYHERIKPCLFSLHVYEMPEVSKPVKAWELRTSGKKCINVDTVNYGEAPKGFAQIGRLAPLRRGLTYRVEVEDQKLRGGSGQFQIIIKE